MTTGLSSSSFIYRNVVGNNAYATNNRIYQLIEGDLPHNLTGENVEYGSAVFSFGAASPNYALNNLYQQAEDIQFSLGALDKTSDELEKVSTRLMIGKSLTKILRENEELTDLQKENIEDQMNYLLGEIDQLAYTANFENVPLLDGTLEENGVYLNLSGNNSTDLTDAFKATTTEALELTYPGEFSLTYLDIDELERTFDDAISRVDNQKQLTESYGEDLFKIFDEIKGAIYSSDTLASASTTQSQFSLSPSSYSSSGNLVLSMGYLSGNIGFDNSAINNIMSLLEER